MKRFEFNKLIRSKLPERMREEGVTLNLKNLSSEEYIEALKEKILEEAKEVAEANSKADLTEELGDLMEVMLTIAESQGINLSDIEQARLKKREQNGFFAPENYACYVELAEGNKKVMEYLENKNYVAVES